MQTGAGRDKNTWSGDAPRRNRTPPPLSLRSNPGNERNLHRNFFTAAAAALWWLALPQERTTASAGLAWGADRESYISPAGDAGWAGPFWCFFFLSFSLFLSFHSCFSVSFIYFLFTITVRILKNFQIKNNKFFKIVEIWKKNQI